MMSKEMNSKEQGNDLDHQQQDASFFSDLATAITGATQTANQEFGRFWEKFVSNKGHANPSLTSENSTILPRHKLQPSQNDISRMRARKNIQGRIIPDNNRGIHIKDAEIQTDHSKTEAIPDPSPMMEDINSRPPLKRRYFTRESDEISSRSPKLPKIDSTPPAKSFSASTFSQTPKPVYSNFAQSTSSGVQEDLEIKPKLLNMVSSVTRPIRSPSIRRSEGSNYNSSHEKHTPDIVTGSSKSVKRLTFELEETFSPRFPPAYSPIARSPIASSPIARSPITASRIGSSPISQSPIVHSVIAHNAFDSSPVSRNTIDTNTDDTSAINNADPFDSKPLVKSVVNSIQPTEENEYIQERESNAHLREIKNKISQRWSREEEDERMEKLEKRIANMRSQVEYISYSSTIKSPKPSHTLTTTTTKEALVKPVSSPIRKTTSGSTTSSPLDNYTISIVSPNKSGSSTIVNRFSSASRVPIPPPPPPQLSPARDFSFGKHALSLRNTISPIVYTSSPSKTPIKNALPLRRPTHNNISFSDHDKKPSPSEKHKLKMKELIQLIPSYQLRKADINIGPDGKEIPNPFWNEIYGKRRAN